MLGTPYTMSVVTHPARTRLSLADGLPWASNRADLRAVAECRGCAWLGTTLLSV